MLRRNVVGARFCFICFPRCDNASTTAQERASREQPHDNPHAERHRTATRDSRLRQHRQAVRARRRAESGGAHRLRRKPQPGHRGGLCRGPRDRPSPRQLRGAAGRQGNRRHLPAVAQQPACRMGDQGTRKRQARVVREAIGAGLGRGARDVRRRAAPSRDAPGVLPVLFSAADARHAGAVERRRHRRRALGAGELRVHGAQSGEQHPDEARAGRRGVAGRGQLRAERDPPGHGVRAATRAGRCKLGPTQTGPAPAWTSA